MKLFEIDIRFVHPTNGIVMPKNPIRIYHTSTLSQLATLLESGAYMPYQAKMEFGENIGKHNTQLHGIKIVSPVG